MHGLKIFVFLLAFSPSLFANSYIFQPLSTPPAPDSVTTFATEPGDPPPEKRLRRDDLLLFLREGRVDVDVFHWPQSSDTCHGIFFTKEGKAYFWSLWSPSVLHLESSENKSCLLVLAHQQVSPTNLRAEILPPKAEDIVDFCNGVKRTGTWQIIMERGDIVRFLSTGKTEIPRDQWLFLFAKGEITPNAPLQAYIDRSNSADLLKNGRIPALDSDVYGAFSTLQGEIYYWQLWDDTLLHLKSASGDCLLKIPLQ